MLVWYLQSLHCTDHCVQAHKYVLIDERHVFFFFFVRIAFAIYNFHLFDESALTRFTCTC